MDLYLQFGWGMMGLSHELCSYWDNGVVILSPRDLEQERLLSFGGELRECGIDTLVDPQFFLPRSDHKRLLSYDYWPDNYDTQEFDKNSIDQMIKRLVNINNQIDTQYIILPGQRAISIDDHWTELQIRFRTSATEQTQRSKMATISLSPEVIKDNEQVGKLMDFEESEYTDSYYLVLEKPSHSYITNDPNWLANSLDIIAGLKRLGSKVVVGYSNQQNLIHATAGADAIASGTWMNIRSFPPEKFSEKERESIKTRAVWYYLPQSLSEFTLPYLDIASRLSLLDHLIPIPNTPQSEMLLNAPQPTASGWGEKEAFRHFLNALRNQALSSTKETFSDTLAYHRYLLDTAETTLKILHDSGINGAHRDFKDAVTAHRAALIVLEKTQGPILTREWSSLI